MQNAISSGSKVETLSNSSNRWRPLSILHTVSSLKFGGMEQFVVRLATFQKRMGHNAAILTLSDGPLSETAQEAGLRVSVLRQSNSATRFLAGLSSAVSIRPDIVHAHNPTSLHYACAAKVVSRAKLVLTDHGQCAGVARSHRDWEARQVNALVSVSADVGDRHQVSFQPLGKKHKVILNGLEFTCPKRSREDMRGELNLPSGLTLIVVARVEPVKDQETLLRALVLLKEQNVLVNLLIVGDGSQRQRLEAAVPQMGLDPDRVRFLGFRSDIPDLLHASDIFVLSSLQEGLPLAVLEAMGQGLPVVATSVGGVPELISHRKDGMLCPPSNPPLLAAMLGELIKDIDFRRRLGQAGALKVETEFSFDQMTKQYENLYFTVLGH
jgi:L-malate glycosyltransferase